MSAEQFTISRRPGWVSMGDITVTIECDPLAAMGVKLGLAVKTAFKARANLAGAYLAGAYLAGADLAGAYLAGADLTGADLTRANLAGADLTRADLAGANLTRANLAGAYLAGAYLAGADLAGANLAGANLAGADLAGAYLAGAKIKGEPVKRLLAQAERLTPGDAYTFRAWEVEAGGTMIEAGCRWLRIPDFRAHVAAEYPHTDKAVETLAILGFLEARAADLGALDAPKPKRTKKVAA